MNNSGGDIANDSDLAARAKSGDSTAFEELVARYQHRIYNVCYRMCHNHADALDLTQTAFLKAYEALPRFQIQARFYTWLFRIAVNTTLSHRRNQRRRPTLSLSGGDDEDRMYEPPAPANGSDPAGDAERDELHRELEEALQRLDDEFRAPVVLRDVEGLDYAAIAEILEVPVGTVKSRIFRGRTMLREMLKHEGSHLDAG